MRLIRISLAAKYRILFGAAVLLILAAALSVPWILTNTLVQEQSFREARRIADYYFRLVLHEPRPAEAPRTSLASDDYSLLEPRSRLPREPRFIRNVLAGDAPDTIAEANQPQFVLDAFRAFARQPRRESRWQYGAEDGGGRFFYAHAIRVGKSCLSCHEQGRGATPYQEGELAGIIAVTLPSDPTDEETVYYRVWLIAAGAGAGILALLVFYVITRRFILSPIHELRGVAGRVTEGDLDVRSTLKTGDEFEQLSASLNAMLERLRTSQDDLKKINRSLDQKLGEMAETNVALYEANRIKSEFLASVSHELRTPLTSIIGFAEVLADAPGGETGGKAARYAENILISGRILLEIINDLLDLAKIEAGKVELHLETVHVDEICRTLIDFTLPLADKKSIALRYEGPERLPVLITDRGRLRQVLYNLLSNAIKFTPVGGSVLVAARRCDDQHVELRVSDTGPGIPSEAQEMIFEKFRQIDQSATREHHGTGLGLAIARELTGLLGGQIGVISTPGEGATFWVRLPLVTSDVKERPMVSLV